MKGYMTVTETVYHGFESNWGLYGIDFFIARLKYQDERFFFYSCYLLVSIRTFLLFLVTSC